MYDIQMSSRSVVISGWATIAAGFVLMAVHYFAGADGDPEGWLAATGFAAPFVGAGCLALVGDRFAKPLLCVAGGGALAVMCVVSIIMIPLVVPAGVMIGSIRNTSVEADSLVVPAIFAVGLVGAFGPLVFHQDPVTWSTPDGGGSSSNIVTSTEASISLIVVIVVVLGSVMWSNRTAPERHRAAR
jgi:hypothetical protein